MRIFLSLFLCSLAFLLHAQNGLSFDGIDDRLSCGNDPSLQLSGSSISLEAWIYPTSWTSQVWQGNIINKENNAPDYGYMLRCGAGGQLNFNIGNGSWNELSSPTNTVSLNVWQHVAGTYDGSMIRLYVNGLLVDSQSVNVNFSSGLQNLTIGNWSNSGNRAFPGIIDEVRIWNVVRTRAEIFNSMNSEFCTAPVGLVAYYQLNEGIAGQSNTSVTMAMDLTANANNGTLTNFTLTGSSSNWVNGSNISPASDFIQITDSTCTDYLGPGGILYDSTGVYLDTLQNSDGCDSIIETSLTVNSVDNGVNTTTNVMVAQQNNAQYQWLDCNAGFSPLAGATNQLLSPPDPNGSYAVIVNYRGCVDTSSCYQLDGLSLEAFGREELSIFPNPGKDHFTLSYGLGRSGFVELSRLNGGTVKRIELETDGETSMSIPQIAKGVYVVLVTFEDDGVKQLLWICD